MNAVEIEQFVTTYGECEGRHLIYLNPTDKLPSCVKVRHVDGVR
jgi:hypothetical protein